MIGNYERASLTKRNSRILTTGLCIISVGVYFLGCVSLFFNELQAFSYLPGFVTDANLVKVAAAFFTVIAVTAFLPKRASAQWLYIWFVFLLVIVPRFVVFGCQDRDWVYPYTCLMVFAIACATCWIIKTVPLNAMNEKRLHYSAGFSQIIVKTIIGLALLTVLYMIATKGFPSLRALNFDEIYEIRMLNSFPGVVKGLLSFLGVFAIPITIILRLSQDDTKSAVVLTVMQLLLFLWTANKAWLLVIILAWGVYFLKRSNLLSIPVVCGVLAGSIVALLLICHFFDSNASLWLFSLFYRRLIIVPAVLGQAYFEFFLENPVVLLDGTIAGVITPTPVQYETLAYQYQISQVVFNSSTGYANTGVFGGEFANFGIFAWVFIWLGMTIVALFLSKARTKAGEGFMLMLAAFLGFSMLNYSYIRLFLSLTGILVLVFIYVCARLIDVQSVDAVSLDDCNALVVPKGDEIQDTAPPTPSNAQHIPSTTYMG